MSVRIRLARGGAKKRPVHKIVVADKRCRRDGRFIEELGFYNPLLPKDSKDALRVDIEAAKKWMAQGAEVTEPSPWKKRTTRLPCPTRTPRRNSWARSKKPPKPKQKPRRPPPNNLPLKKPKQSKF